MFNNPNNWLNRKREYSKMSEDSMQTTSVILYWTAVFGSLIGLTSFAGPIGAFAVVGFLVWTIFI